MIIRIVKLSLRPENLPDFMDHFNKIKSGIRNYPGCSKLELLADAADPAVVFTYSHWESEEHLAGYLQSSFFKNTWSLVKPLFRAPATAWSLHRVIGGEN